MSEPRVVAPVDADGDGFVAGEDCDDDDPDVHPEAPEACDAFDRDCDGVLGLDDPDNAPNRVHGFVDHDGDGAGQAAVIDCPQRLVYSGGDCDDQDATVHPNAVEVCDGIDQDCDGEIDNGVQVTWYLDSDADGWGDLASTGCAVPAGSVDRPGDCDDLDPEVHPDAIEGCDGIDNDCDGLLDSADAPFDAELLFLDADLDGVGSEFLVWGCLGEAGYAELSGDCDDLDPLRTPGADEVCDGVDNDCDGHPDRADPAFEGTPLGCDQCPDFDPARPVRVQSVNPCLLDSEGSFGCYDGTILIDTHTFGWRLHRGLRRDDTTLHRPQLMLYLPPSGAQHSNEVPQWAAELGYLTVTLDWYPSSLSIARHCEDEVDVPACVDGVVQEVVFGGNLSPIIDLSPGNNLTRELARMLTHLDSTDPGHGWGEFLVADDQVAWDHVQILAWSKGASPGGMLAQQVEVAGLTALGTRMSEDRLVFTRPWATSGDHVRLVGHVSEWATFQSIIEGTVGPSISADFTSPVDLDTASWPWPTGSAAFTTATGTPSAGCVPHTFVASDDCMAISVLQPAYRNLFCSF